MPEFEKEEELGREKAMTLKETLKFPCKSDLKNELKTNNSSHLIAKTRFPTRCFSKSKKIHNFVAINLF